MPQTADKVVVEVEVALNGASANAAAAQVEGSVNRIAASTGRAESVIAGASSHIGQSYEEVSKHSGRLETQVARMAQGMIMGESATEAITRHIALFGLGLAKAESVGGLFAEMLTGGIVVGAVLAISAIIKLISAHEGHTDAVTKALDKLRESKEQSAANAEADRIWSTTIEGLTDRIGKLNAELQKRLTTQLEIERHTLAQAQFDQAEAQNAVTRTGGDVNSLAGSNANAALTAANRTLTAAQQLASAQAGEAMTSAATAAKNYSDELDIIARKLQTLHPELAQGVGADQLRAAIDGVKKAMGEGLAAGLNLNPARDQINGLVNQLAHLNIPAATFEQRMRQIAASVNASTEAFKNQDQAVKQFEQTILGAGGPEGRGRNRMGSSAAGIGQFMPGTFETYFRQLNPGTQLSNGQIDALRGNRQVAEDVMHAATEDYIRVLKAAGQNITQASLYTVHLLGAPDARRFFRAPDDESVVAALGNTPHARAVAAQNGRLFSGTVGQARTLIAQRVGDPTALRAPADAAAAIADQAQIELEQRRTFTRTAAELDQRELAAREKTVTGETALYDLKVEQINRTEAQNVATYQQLQGEGKLTDLQARTLIARAHVVANVERQELLQQHELKLQQDGVAFYEQWKKSQLTDLQWQEANAKTSAARHAIQLQILEAERQIAVAAAQEAMARAQANKDWAAYDVARQQLFDAQAAYKRGTADNDKQNASPQQKYLDDLHQTADQINESIQQISVDGLKSLNDEITNAIMGTESLGTAFKNVADQIISALIKIAIQQMFIKPLAGLLFGGGGGGGGGGGLLASLLGGIFGGGTTAGAMSASNSLMGGSVLDLLMPRASGGPVTAGRPYVVGEEGQELFIPNQSGVIVPNNRLGMNAGNSVAVTINAPGATMETVAMIRREIRSAAPTLVAAAQQTTMKSLSRRRP